MIKIISGPSSDTMMISLTPEARPVIDYIVEAALSKCFVDKFYQEAVQGVKNCVLQLKCQSKS